MKTNSNLKVWIQFDIPRIRTSLPHVSVWYNVHRHKQEIRLTPNTCFWIPTHSQMTSSAPLLDQFYDIWAEFCEMKGKISQMTFTKSGPNTSSSIDSKHLSWRDNAWTTQIFFIFHKNAIISWLLSMIFFRNDCHINIVHYNHAIVFKVLNCHGKSTWQTNKVSKIYWTPLLIVDINLWLALDVDYFLNEKKSMKRRNVI
jgi:hypothetical protein